MTWQKGQSGNLAGRPKGTKVDQLKSIYTNDLWLLWREGGEAALRRVMQSDPVSFCKLVAAVLPRDQEKRQEVIHSIEVTLRRPLWLEHDVVTNELPIDSEVIDIPKEADDY